MSAKRFKPWYIKERDNGQSARCYYVAEGRMSPTSAARKEKPLVGTNIMHRFETEAAYRAEIDRLMANGERFV